MSTKPLEILYLASKNQHKLAELTSMIGDAYDVRLCTELDPEMSWQETGDTFAANALIKAEAVRKLTSCAVLADDSGLEVEALDGAPGIYSSRYGGIDGDDARNNSKLLSELAARSITSQAKARFVCCLVYLPKDGGSRTKKIFEGTCEGEIIREARGAEGFGYDPLFVVAGGDRTLAEYSADEKNTISHRKKALEKFSIEVMA